MLSPIKHRHDAGDAISGQIGRHWQNKTQRERRLQLLLRWDGKQVMDDLAVRKLGCRDEDIAGAIRALRWQRDRSQGAVSQQIDTEAHYSPSTSFCSRRNPRTTRAPKNAPTAISAS